MPSLYRYSRSLLLSAVVLFELTLIAPLPASGQTLQVLHYFTAGSDGSAPYAGLVRDRGGNLYGTTELGGRITSNCPGGCGTVFRLKPQGSGWIYSVLYRFQGGADGSGPGTLVIGPDGSLYGTTGAGGGGGCIDSEGCGTVFKLRPPGTFCAAVSCPWEETILYVFPNQDQRNGQSPASQQLIFDRSGNIYGTTASGGSNDFGVVFELSPSTGGWTEQVLHNFAGPPDDGISPWSGVIFDSSGNLYGTAQVLPSGGMLYELTPTQSGWTETILHNFFGNDGSMLWGGLIFDSAGNLYGATASGGVNGGGTVFELSPSGSNWNLSVLYSLSGEPQQRPAGPVSGLTMDAAGNLYGGTTKDGLDDEGAVFKLTPNGGSWVYTSLHDFDNNGQQGQSAWGSVLRDTAGNVYGTTVVGGQNGNGVVFEITP